MLGVGSGTSGGLGANVRAMPIWVPEPMAIDRIGCEVTAAGDAGSLIRLGLWDDAGNGALPAALHLDSGTTPGDVVQQAELVLPSAPNLLSAQQASIETDSSGFAMSSNCSWARSTAVGGADGLASLAVTSLAPGTMGISTSIGVAGVPVVGGGVYSATGFSRAATVARNTSVKFDWYTAAGAYISSSGGSGTVNSTSAWTAHSAQGTAPANAAFAAVVGVVTGTAAGGEVHYFDKFGVYAGAQPAGAWALAGSGRLDIGAYWLGAQMQNWSVTQPSMRVCLDRIGAPVAPSVAGGIASAVLGATLATAGGPFPSWSGGQSIIGQCPRLAVRAA